MNTVICVVGVEEEEETPSMESSGDVLALLASSWLELEAIDII